MRWRPLFACAAALGLLGAGAPQPIGLRALEGAEVQIARGPGEPDVVLHFWATWCSECAQELPSLASAARACDPARVRVLAVDVGEAPALVKAYLAEHAFALPVLLDPGGRAWRQAGFFGLPSNLVWTAQGVTTSSGPTSAERWRELLAGLGCAPASAGAEGPASP
jgi:thiol-disulfide isomerase/thioredoxin